MEEKFKLTLQEDIVKHFSRQALLLSGLLIALFSFFALVPQQYGIYRDSRLISKTYNKFVTHHERLLRDLSQGAIQQYLSDKPVERDVYRDFYSARSSMTVRSNLLVFNAEQDLQLMTDNQLTPLAQSLQLKLVMKQSSDTPIKSTVIIDGEGNHYLAMIAAIKARNRLVGYSVLLINGNDFLTLLKSLDSRYLIFDEYQSPFLSNSDSFMMGSLGKVDETILTKRLIFSKQKAYLSQTSSLAPAMTVTVYRQLLPITAMLIFALCLSASIFAVLLWQSKQLGDKIATKNSVAIETLVSEMEAVSKGEKRSIDLKTEDEFSYLAAQMNQMIQRLYQLSRKALLLEKERQTFERRMLEAQFHPHFLYNTLETILITSQFDPKLTETIVLRLTRLLRYSLNHDHQQETIANDLAIVESYLQINQVRFEELDYQLTYDDNIKEIRIPKLVLLPLVENSIKYGYRYRHDLVIHIHVKKEAGYLWLSVEDNGPGISEARQQQVLANLQTMDSHHGVINSYRRLVHQFHDVELQFNRTGLGFGITFKVREDNGV
ncbi:sensor histidine kinase [Streptococcus jiangjianxini]|uniref:sensor histidine kinase n=1 Tax=Streptococcus jiangjianxini TaxID=3161189 RepID=UPI0032EB1F85